MSDLTAMWLLGIGVGFPMGVGTALAINYLVDRFYLPEDDSE